MSNFPPSNFLPSNSLPSPLAGVQPGVAPFAFAVQPAALASAPAGLLQRALLLRAGSAALFSAWDQAAAALAGCRTGALLAATRPGSSAAVDGCAASVEALASSLRLSATIYASAESAAWMP
ncbi:MAG TPA: hypothetical protein VHX15_09915 [Frankiaceae bacterium]|jgi:hypothetical protein|nr:hypothetical protein [Frankiaceae bacterium]